MSNKNMAQTKTAKILMIVIRMVNVYNKIANVIKIISAIIAN